MASTATITQGEAPTLTLTATTDGSTAFDITGASIQTKFEKSDGTELTVDNSAHSIITAASGIYTVDLTAVQTALLKVGDEISIVSILTISAKEYYVWYDGSLRVRSATIKDQ